MKQVWNEHDPSEAQIAECKRVEQALANEINLLAREGVPVAILLSAIGMTAADLITCQAGAEAVPMWFEKQGAMLRALQTPN